MSADNIRRLSSILNIDLLDPLLEAMIDSVFVPGGANVSVEFNFLPFVVDESEMDHSWHPGPMEVDEYSDEEGHNDEDKDEEGGEEQEEEEDGEEGMPLFSDFDDEYNDEYNDQYNDEEVEEQEQDEEEEEEDYGDGIEDDDEEDENGHDYSSQHEDDDEDEIDEEDDDEDDDDEDLRLGGFIDDSVRENYGSLGYNICHNIIHRKILHETFNSRYFLRQMVEFFFTNLKQDSVLASTVALQKLLNCLPLLSDLKTVIAKAKYTTKEAVIVKVVLEMYESYHSQFGAPNFKTYHEEVIPLLLEFYNRLPEGVLKIMSIQLKRVLNLKYLTDNFTLYNTKQEYLSHYRDATRKMRNLSESADPSLFIR